MGKDQSPLTKILVFLGVAVIMGFLIKFGLLRIINPEDFEPAPPLPNLPPVKAIYDSEASKQRLEAIGRALQLYREEVGILPVAERKKPADAGLPPGSIQEVLSSQGHKWSVRPNVFFLEVMSSGFGGAQYLQPSRIFSSVSPSPSLSPNDSEARSGPGADPTVSAAQLPPKPFTLNDAPALLQKRGDDLPILVDPYVGTKLRKQPDPKNLQLLILRLSGKVDLVKAKDLDLRRIALED